MNCIHSFPSRRPAWAFACLLLVSSGVHAETLADLKGKLAQFTADLAMPTTPAAVHVGMSADTVIQPKNQRDFEGAVSNLLKDGGKPAGALEFLPYYILQGGKLSYSNYEQSFLFRALTNTSIGLAAGTREIGPDKVEASANGLSLSTVILDLSDPVHDWNLQNCINSMQKTAIKEAKAAGATTEQPFPTEDQESEFTESDVVATPKAEAEYSQCLTEFRSRARLWNRSRVGFGVAGGNGHESSGEQRKLKYGTAWWASAQYGFEGLRMIRRALSGRAFVDCANDALPPGMSQEPVPNAGAAGTEKTKTPCEAVQANHWREKAMLTLHARRVTGASDLDLSQPGELPTVSRNIFGTRLTYGGEKRNFFVEVSRLSMRHSLNGSSSTNQHAFGTSVKLLDNLWLNVISGRRKEFASDRSSNVVQINLAYGLSSDPLVKN